MKTKFIIIAVAVLVLSLTAVGFLLSGLVSAKTQNKILASDRNMWKSVAARCFSAKPQVTVIYKPVEGHSDAIYHPKPKPNPYEPSKDSGNIVPIPDNPADTGCVPHYYQDTLKGKDLAVVIETSVLGTIEWMRMPWFRIYEKTTSTTYAPILVHDTLYQPVYKTLWGAYGGVGTNLNDPLLARAGIFTIFKTKIGFQAGAMYFHGMTHPFFVEGAVFVPFNKANPKK